MSCKACILLAEMAADTMMGGVYTPAIHNLMSHYNLDHAPGYRDSKEALNTELQGFARAGWSVERLSEFSGTRLARIEEGAEAG